MRKDRVLRALPARRSIASEKEPRAGGEARKGAPVPARRVIEFPKPLAVTDVISDTIIFDIGSDLGGNRFAIKWRAEIEQLPPAGPVFVVERKQGLNSGRSARRRR